MKKTLIIIFVSVGLMSFTIPNDKTSTSDEIISSKISTEFSFDLCSQRDCLENPDGSTTCGEWYEIPCDEGPIGPNGGPQTPKQ